MNIDHPFEVVTTAVDGDVLTALATADQAFTGRELHRVIGRHSQTGVNKVLNRLVDQGIVARTRAGAARTYRLNRDHLLAEHIVGIACAKDSLLQQLRAALGRWKEPPAYAAIFGSTARTGSNQWSDIDLLLVHRDDVDPDAAVWSEQVEHLVSDVRRWTGNDVRPVMFGRAEARSLVRAKDPFLLSVRRDAVTLAGSTTFLRPLQRRVRA